MASESVRNYALFIKYLRSRHQVRNLDVGIQTNKTHREKSGSETGSGMIMNTRERILSIRLAEAIKKQPEFAKRLQLRFVMKEPIDKPVPMHSDSNLIISR